MLAILALNLLGVALAILMPNEVLKWHSWALYGLQLLTLLPYLARRARLASNLFQPSVFVLAYFLVSLTFGSYLVPREYGWTREFAGAVQLMGTYRIAVPYLMLAHVALFLVACHGLSRIARLPEAIAAPASARSTGDGAGLGALLAGLACMTAFLAVTAGEVFSAFSFQLALLVLHLPVVARRRDRSRFLVYAVYLGIMVAFGFGNKREIAIVLFLMLFLESFYGRYRLRLSIGSLAAYTGAGLAFMLLILTASILRGYGDFGGGTLLDALVYVPRYIGSDVFVDGLTDNLELNSSYGSAVAAIDLSARGRIPYQYGATLWKVFFLPVPRSVFPAKPESAMALFTDRFAWPSLWADNGSLPVIVSSEMFMNFSVLGLVPFVMLWLAIDRLFLVFHTSAPHSFRYNSSLFAVLSVLLLARGSGLEQYLLYYLFAMPIFAVAGLVAQRSALLRPEPEPT